jgi:hypothetical protein
VNLLREYVRELLTEAAKGLADLGDMVVYVDHAGGEIEVWIIDPTIVPPETDKRRRFQMNQAAIGLISAVQESGECLDGYVVTWAHVDDEHKGWGPMLYDIAMELATQAGTGLLSDRNNVSYEASNVWQYYAGSRGDVEAVQLDDYDGHLTPEIEEDDCLDHIVYTGRGIESGGFWDGDLNDDGEEETPWDPYGKDILLKSPLSKLYKSTGTPTLDMLRSAGKLVEL